jgi:DNA-binding NtrC family response regulator
MRELFSALEAATRSLLPVFVVGARGTGKRLVAEEIHRLTARTGAPGMFVSFPNGSRASGPPSDIEALFFGPGGLLEQARGGTFYLDLDAAPFGESLFARLADELARTTSEAAAVRLVVATRTAGSKLPAPLARLFAAGGARLVLPPLSARETDFVLLARHFWAELGGTGSLPDHFAVRFESHTWPGNVRELRVVVEAWISHGAGDDVGFGVVPLASRPTDALARLIESDLPFARARRQIVAEFERRYVARALLRNGNRVGRAAAASGIAQRYFQVLKSRAAR